MKKIYMVFCLLATLFTFSNLSLIAQSSLANCFGTPSTSPNAKVYHLKGFNSPGPLTNTVSFIDMPVGSVVRLYPNSNTGGVPPLVEHTFVAADNGKFSWSYLNSSTTPPVVICVSSIGQGCCLKSVPALLDCADGQAINFAPFMEFGECRMLIKVNIGDAIQLLNSAGQVVTGVVEVQARVPVGNGQEIACVRYPCGTILGTITACGALNCCSRPFVLGGPLPILLTDFRVSHNQQGKALLSWSSAVEVDSKSYIVEKGTNGIDFTAIGETNAKGSSFSILNYSFTDNNITTGRIYYRLKMVDLNGKFEYSKVVSINNGKAGASITVGPNPFTTSIQLYGILSTEIKPANIQVLNSVGQQVKYKIVGASTITLDESAAKGMYIIKIKSQQFKMLKL
jgi:hypothetical protein